MPFLHELKQIRPNIRCTELGWVHKFASVARFTLANILYDVMQIIALAGQAKTFMQHALTHFLQQGRGI